MPLQAGALQDVHAALLVGAQYLMQAELAAGLYVARVRGTETLTYRFTGWISLAALGVKQIYFWQPQATFMGGGSTCCT